MDVNIIKKQFPVFAHDPTLAYLDSAATTLTPKPVIDTMNVYYEQCPVNVRRGMYTLSEKANAMLMDARKKVADFIHADTEEIIFTSGTTQSLNLLASMLEVKLTKKSNIVLTRLEHHANLIPWQELAKRTGASLRFIELDDHLDVDATNISTIIDEHTAIVSFTLASNVFRSHIPTQEIISAAKRVHAMTVIDAAQAVGHTPINVKELYCDFLVFSGHKMYGPKGIGVLYGKKNLLNDLEPALFGGEMIREVSYTQATWGETPHKFEAGTQNIPAIIGLGAAVSFIETMTWEHIQAHECEVFEYAIDTLQKINEIKIIGSVKSKHQTGPISFVIDAVHPHDIAEVLNSKQVAVRAGHHCAMPLMGHLGLIGTVRLSFGVYSSQDDIDRCRKGLSQAIQLFTAK